MLDEGRLRGVDILLAHVRSIICGSASSRVPWEPLTPRRRWRCAARPARSRGGSATDPARCRVRVRVPAPAGAQRLGRMSRALHRAGVGAAASGVTGCSGDSRATRGLGHGRRRSPPACCDRDHRPPPAEVDRGGSGFPAAAQTHPRPASCRLPPRSGCLADGAQRIKGLVPGKDFVTESFTPPTMLPMSVRMSTAPPRGGLVELALKLAGLRRSFETVLPTVRSTDGNSFGPMTISATMPISIELRPADIEHDRSLPAAEPRPSFARCGPSDGLLLGFRGGACLVRQGTGRLGRLGRRHVVVLGHALLEGLDPLRHVTHQIGDLAPRPNSRSTTASTMIQCQMLNEPMPYPPRGSYVQGAGFPIPTFEARD